MPMRGGRLLARGGRVFATLRVIAFSVVLARGAMCLRRGVVGIRGLAVCILRHTEFTPKCPFAKGMLRIEATLPVLVPGTVQHCKGRLFTASFITNRRRHGGKRLLQMQRFSRRNHWSAPASGPGAYRGVG